MNVIAIPVSGNLLSPHFGQCEEFRIYEVDDSNITDETTVPAPPHQPGMLPQWLSNLGVTDIIAGGMGHKAINLFNQFKINVFVGAPQKAAKNIIREFLDGTLVLTSNYCNH
jgi:predicted Fe-Mo cluster-binding NifX family protein